MSPSFLIDVNLPRFFSLWNNGDYIHQYDLDDQCPYSEIWKYAKEYNLTIITKDTDFSVRMIIQDPPPKVIHIKLGNMKMKQFHDTLNRLWPSVLELNMDYKLVNVFSDRIEGIM